MWGVLFPCIAVIIIIVICLLIYKLLRTPEELDGYKLYLDVFPKPRWRVRRIEQKRQRRVLFLTYGTRGDVQPLVVLARELAKQNIKVAISTCDSFKQFVQDESHGSCQFISCGVPYPSQPTSLKQSQTFAQVIGVFGEVYHELAQGMYRASVEFDADLIISPALVRGIASQCAEKLQVPFWSMHFAPSNTPTYEFPPSGYANHKYGAINKLLYAAQSIEIAKACVNTGLSKTDQDFRAITLQLAPLPVGDLVSDVEREPSIHAYSPLLRPKPRDWSRWTLVCGSLTNNDDDDGTTAQLDVGLMDFISRGKANHDYIVYVGLGSMENVQELMGDIVCALEAMHGIKLRIVVSSYTMCSSSVGKRMVITQAPHMLLFPHCDLVIHHGGAGTTHAAMECGAPQLVFPVLQWSDQPFWASQVECAGIGLHYNSSEFTAKDFGIKVKQCLDMKPKAAALAAQQHPNGKHVIAQLITRYFNTL